MRMMMLAKIAILHFTLIAGLAHELEGQIMHTRGKLTSAVAAFVISIFAIGGSSANEKKERCIDLMADVAIAAKGNKAWSGTYHDIPEFKVWYAECWRMDNITKNGYTCMDAVRGWIGSAAFYRDTSQWEAEYAIKCGRLLD